MNKIGWCDMTWNPVWGCLNNCEYCYARGIAKRFGNIRFFEEWKYRIENNIDSANKFKLKNSLDLIDFKLTFLHSQFNKKLPKKPQRIFVGSMSEIYYWKPEWIEIVIEKVKEYPQHTFQFLTKYPNEVYFKYDFPKNCWLGITVTKETDMYKNDWNYLYGKNIYFISFEPLLEEINLHFLNHKNIDWVIVGAETGNRKGKIIPKKQWVWDIIQSCDKHKIPVYIKDNLSKYYPQFKDKKEFPKEIK